VFTCSSVSIFNVITISCQNPTVIMLSCQNLHVIKLSCQNYVLSCYLRGSSLLWYTSDSSVLSCYPLRVLNVVILSSKNPLVGILSIIMSESSVLLCQNSQYYHVAVRILQVITLPYHIPQCYRFILILSFMLSCYRVRIFSIITVS
jgi:hypothetical protein